MPAPAPSRSTFKITIQIGLAALACAVYTGVEDSNVRRSYFVKDDKTKEYHPAGMTWYDKITGVNLSKTDLTPMVECHDGSLVEVSDEEMDSLLTAESGDCTFIGFLPQAEFEKNFVAEKVYQIRPEKVKTKKNPYEKPFALILDAMQRKNSVGLLSFVSRGRTRFAAIHPDGTLHTLYYEEEVRERLPMPQAEFTDAEVKIGDGLIDTFSLTDVPVFNDADSEKIMEFALNKAKAQADGKEFVIQRAEQTEAAPATDLMALFAASVKEK